MTTPYGPRRHGTAQSFALHVAPGAAMLVAYLYGFAPLVARWGLPTRLAYVLTLCVIVWPMLAWPAGRAGVFGARRLREATSDRKVALIVLVLLIWAAGVSMVGKPVDEWVRAHVFGWLPPSIGDSVAVDVSGHPPTILIGTRLVSTFVVGVVVPLAEEFYFRGYLLPRMPWSGTTRIVVHSAMFAGSHFLSPWAFVTRMLVLIPMVAAIVRTRRLAVGIWLHCTANTFGELMTLAAVMQRLDVR